MKKKCILLFILLLTISALFRTDVIAEKRNIYIGDIIRLQINSAETTKEDIMNALSQFEVTDIKEIDNGYEVSFRSFDIGDKVIKLGNKEITVSISSTLNDYDREDIFESDMTVRGSTKVINWFMIYMILIVILAISLIILLISYIKSKRNSTNITPFVRFNNRLESLEMSSISVLVDMTAILKSYLEEVHNCTIRGKTSNEIMDDIDKIPNTSSYRAMMSNWLTICDAYKFSGELVNEEQKEGLRVQLRHIGSCINQKEGEVR